MLLWGGVECLTCIPFLEFKGPPLPWSCSFTIYIHSISSTYIGLYFLSLDIGDVERPKNCNPFFFQLFRTMPLNLKILTDHQTSVLHLMFLTSSWPLVDCTSPVMSAFLLGTEQTSNQSTNWSAFHNPLELDLCWLYSIPVDPKRTWLDTARVNLLDIAKINFFFTQNF